MNMRIKHRIGIPLLLLLALSCRQERKESQALFTLLLPSYTGVEFSNRLTEDEDFNMIEYLYFNNGAGVGVGDINNDGYPDLSVASSLDNTVTLLLGDGKGGVDPAGPEQPRPSTGWKSRRRLRIRDFARKEPLHQGFSRRIP